MREKVRTLPIDKCYIWPAEWKESGMAQVTVTRRKPNGHLVVGIFLVDIYCLGVKNTIVRHDVSEAELMESMRPQLERHPMEEISYEEAHNLIYGAIAYAEDAGIPRYKEFYPAAYVLEEDTEEIPLIEYEYGYEGKPYLVVGPEMREMRYLEILRKKLGDGNFNYTIPMPLDGDRYIPDEDEEEYFLDVDEEDEPKK